MPRDPFADDPHDPASFLEDDEPVQLSPEQLADVARDVELLSQFRRLLSPKGVRGVFFFCEDCQINHYYDWDILAAEMQATLRGQLPAVHEPSAEIDYDAYVPWDYCLGYLDGHLNR